MSEFINEKKIFTLFEVSKSIQKTLSERYTSSFWVKAEMNKLNFYKHSGHCYPELVEKSNGKTIAQIRSILWKSDFERINRNFIELLHEPLKDGIKILFLANITFDPAHGLALSILEIDPSYTLGDLEKEKNTTIKCLKDEGLYNKNKLLKLPILPQRIAILSVESSKGYIDFLSVLEGKENPWNYRFFHMLFPCLLQGDNAINSIVQQLNKIKKVAHHFDAVAIIRGGGGDVGLSCYNNYQLACAIANFPLPVLTGIGHATNETVVEMISHSNAITPTKLAESLLQTFHNFSVPVSNAEITLSNKSKQILNEQNNKFESTTKLFRSATENILMQHKIELKSASKSISQLATFQIKNSKNDLTHLQTEILHKSKNLFYSEQSELKGIAKQIKKDSITLLTQHTFNLNQLGNKTKQLSKTFVMHRQSDLENIEKNIYNMSPNKVMQRGYSITLSNGKAVKNLSEIKEGETIETRLFEGRFTSVVKSKKAKK